MLKFSFKRISLLNTLPSEIKGYNVVIRNTARSALCHFLLSARVIGNRNQVLLPSFCCQSVYLSVVFAGCTPVFVDVNMNTFSLLQADLDKKISGNTLAIIYPHMFGINGIDYNFSIDDYRKNFPDVIWIEDACQTYIQKNDNGNRLGTQLDVGLFSCDSTKPVKGELGLIVQFSESSLLCSIFDRIKDTQKFQVPAWRIKELKRFESSFFTAMVAAARLGHPDLPNGISTDCLKDLYFDNSSPDNSVMMLSTKEIRVAMEMNTFEINFMYARLNKRIKEARLDQVTCPDISSRDAIWRYPIVIQEEVDACELSYRLRQSGIQCSNHYYSLASLFNINRMGCPTSNSISNRMINVWFEDPVEVDICANIFKEYYRCRA